MTNKINWVSALDPGNILKLESLQDNMKSFYFNNTNGYYDNDDFNFLAWNSNEWAPQQFLLQKMEECNKVLEVGCGRSGVLVGRESLQYKYTGIDFSDEIVRKNIHDFPNANFNILKDPLQLPYSNESFDCVFSHFVLEHAVFPHLFIKEQIRVLKRGGILAIISPEFLNNSMISSQRLGLSAGTGTEKFKKGFFLDSLLTAFDAKIKLPLYCFYLRHMQKRKPLFMINLSPVCFTDNFKHDYDAVYVTSSKEVEDYFSKDMKWIKPVLNFPAKRKTLFLIGNKI